MRSSALIHHAVRADAILEDSTGCLVESSNHPLYVAALRDRVACDSQCTPLRDFRRYEETFARRRLPSVPEVGASASTAGPLPMQQGVPLRPLGQTGKPPRALSPNLPGAVVHYRQRREHCQLSSARSVALVPVCTA